MALSRDDRWLTDALGRALAGAQVYWCNQPANTSVIPPSPLATIFADTEGDPWPNPQTTDGFGHAYAYLTPGGLYTLVFVHPLFGPNPIVLPDQPVPSTGALPLIYSPGGVPNGTLRTFTLTFSPVNPTEGLLFVSGSYIPYGASSPGSYTISGNVITWTGATPPQTGDVLVYYGS
jgi:hypothetical protein